MNDSNASDRHTRPLNTKSAQKNAILYWMDRDLRAEDNWALYRAAHHACTQKVPLVVGYNLQVNFLGGQGRQWQFKLETLQELQQDLAKKNIPLVIWLDESNNGEDSVKSIGEFCEAHNIGRVVTDFSPLKIQRRWKEKLAETVELAVEEVDAHNVVPVWVASLKQEFGAYTLRPKLHRLLMEFMQEPRQIPDLDCDIQNKAMEEFSVHAVNWDKLRKQRQIVSENPTYKVVFRGGKRTAHDQLAHFLQHGLPLYADQRNDPLAEAQSNLAPYLHYGILSAQRVAWEVVKRVGAPLHVLLDEVKNKAKVDTKVDKHPTLTLHDHAGAFLEELLVRRELADNFCFYNKNYDAFEGFPAWAKKTLEQHRADPREYIYSLEEFEQAQTHDELWNAAQNELLKTGKMHGYLRMYWAKKILEWSVSPEAAMQIAISLNDRYELDGRDPNGYAGIAWSIGGVHDRAWFERPIFGQIRFMARSGCEKKFDVEAYIQKWNGATQ